MTKADNTAAISVKHVAKEFKLAHEKAGSIKSGVLSVFRSKNRTVEVQRALKDISFDVKEGEFFGILGKNGSGKSTLLKILAEIYQPSKGSVDIKGKLVPFIELGVGFNPELTGRENVYLNGALLGFSKKQIDAIYDDIVAFAELENFMDQKLKNYSSGMQVRLAFSVATRAEADILLVDEVLAVGDADFQRKCYDYFKSLKKSGKTVVFVTHDMGAVKEYCDKAILVHEGVIIHSGSANFVADEYLKLFNQAADNEEAETDTERWGVGTVRCDAFKLRIQDDEITIDATLSTTLPSVDDVVVGIKLMDASGVVVAGGSTINAKAGARNTLSVSKDKKTKLTFGFKNILGAGTYNVGVTVRSANHVTVYDNWENAAKLSIAREETYYPVVLPIDLTVEE